MWGLGGSAQCEAARRESLAALDPVLLRNPGLGGLHDGDSKAVSGPGLEQPRRELLVTETSFPVTVAPHPKLISAPRRQLAYLQPKNTFPVYCSVC